jgi:hypothetical protein
MNKPIITVYINGGLITDVIKNAAAQGVSVEIRDYDADSYDENELTKDDGSSKKYFKTVY